MISQPSPIRTSTGATNRWRRRSAFAAATTPRGTLWLADYLRLSKGGFAYFWRSHLDPVANHHIREPVRFWSLDGPDEDVLQALAERRLDGLPRVTSAPEAQREQAHRGAGGGAQPTTLGARQLLGL